MSFSGVVFFRDGEPTWTEDVSSAEDAALWLQTRAETGWTGIELDMDGAPTGVLLRYFDPAGDGDTRRIRERIARLDRDSESGKIPVETGDLAARVLQRLATRLAGGPTMTSDEAVDELFRVKNILSEKK